MPGYFYIENHVDNFIAMSTSQKCYTQTTTYFLRGLLFEKNYSLTEKLNHFLMANILILFYLERKHLKIIKCRSQCLKRQQLVDKMHIMRSMSTQTIFAFYMEHFIRTLQKTFS